MPFDATPEVKTKEEIALDTFFEKLRTTRRRWVLADYCAIRLWDGYGTHCPISAVTGNTADYGRPVDAARYKLGLDGITASKIMLAADDAPGCDMQMRRRLLEACGLA